MNTKCEHCDYEGPKETFTYLYNIRLDDGASWHECPKCHGWNFLSAKDGSARSFEETARGYKIHSDLGVGVHKPI